MAKTKTRKKFSHKQYHDWGITGGSPILLAWAKKHPVKGYKVVHGKNGKDRD